MTRSPGNCCRRCAAFEATGDDAVCRLGPPAVTVIMVQQKHPITQQVSVGPQNFSSWPIVKGEQWCRQFEASGTILLDS